MGRKESRAWDCIHSFCATNKMDEQNLYKRARLLLSSYGGLCWSRSAWDVLTKDPFSTEDALCTQLAFHYLRNYSEDETKQEFITRVSNLMDVRVLQEIVNHTLLRVREFPVFGKIHFEILNKCYLSSVGIRRMIFSSIWTLNEAGIMIAKRKLLCFLELFFGLLHCPTMKN